jgi:hypothetical protein
MAALTVQERQILSLIRALPLARRRLLLSEIARDSEAILPRTTAREEVELRCLAMEKGLDLLHEED